MSVNNDGFTTRALVLRLVAKDVYLNRQMMTSAFVGGLVALVLCTTGKTGYSIGGVLYITAMLAFGVVLAMYNIAQERKERSALFVLSLPLAPRDYVHAKLLGTTLTFFIPWSVLSVGAILVIWITPTPDGAIPITVLILVYFLFTFSVMAAVALLVNCDAKMTLAIICTNMSVTFFMFGIARVHGIGGFEQRATPLWSGAFFVALACELALIAIAFAVPLVYYSRKRDFL